MQNLAVKTEYIAVKELAELKGVSIRAIQKACQQGKYEARQIDGNGGKQYEILFASIEPELQQAYQNQLKPPYRQEVEILPPDDFLYERKGVDCFAPLAMTEKQAGTALVAVGDRKILNQVQNDGHALVMTGKGRVEAPEKAKQIALAKYELLRNLEIFAENYKNESANFPSHLVLNVRTSQNNDRVRFLLKNEKITVEESAKFLNISKRAIQMKITSKKLKTETTTGRGGTKYLVYVSSLPEEKQLEYYEKNKDRFVDCFAPLAMTGASAMTKNTLAMTKNELAITDKKPKKTEIVKAFVEACNNGLYLHIYNIIGKISVQSLYRWQKLVGNTCDYTNLIPQYQYNMGEYKTGLSQEEVDTFKKIILHQNKFDIGKAISWTRETLSMQGIESMSSYSAFYRWAEDFKKNHYDEWIFAREGRKSYDDKVKPYVMRDYSKIEVGDIFVADGHRLDFRVEHPFTGKPVRALIVAYQDMKSCGIAGFEIMVNENTQCVASALRNSIINFGKMPLICYQDNGSAFKNKFFKGSKNFQEANLAGVFENLGIKTIFSKPYNGKAKIIERFWKEFGSFEKLLASYVGNNIENKPAYMARNEKYHKEIHDETVLSIEQTIWLVSQWLEKYHKNECPHVKGKTIGEVFNSGKGSGVDVDLLDDLLMSEKIGTVGRNGVKFMKQFYWNTELHGLKGKVVIKHSLFDIMQIKVYSLKGKYICTAGVKEFVHPAAHLLGTAVDQNSLNQAIKEHDRLERETRKKVKKIATGSIAFLQDNIIEQKAVKKIETKQQESYLDAYYSSI